jgi:CRISPR-associated protein Cas2
MVVSYDIVDDRKRARLARLLKGYLLRVQKSVFEGEVEERRLEELRQRVKKIVDLEVDSVRFYTLCQRCRLSVEVMGTGIYIERDDEDVVI